MNRHREEMGQSGRIETIAVGRKRSKKEASAMIYDVFGGILWATWAFFLGSCAVPFAAYPFGIGLLCAASRRVPYIFAGLCLSALGMTHPAVRILAYTSIVLIRLLTRFTIDAPERGPNGEERARTLGEIWPHLFSEQVGLRMATSCVGTFIVGVYVLIRGGFLYYDLYGALVGVVACPVSTLVFSWVFEKDLTPKARRLSMVSFWAIGAAVSYAARSTRVLGISIAPFGIMLLTLYVTRRYGTLKGVFTGSLCGLAYSPSLFPIFGFGALCGGLFFSVSVTLSVLVNLVAGSAWALYISGIGALSGLLPALLSANLLYPVMDKLFLTERAEERLRLGEGEGVSVKCTALASSEADSLCLFDTSERLRGIEQSFFELSEIFSAMGRTMPRPSDDDLRRICESAFESSCGTCSVREHCWDEEGRAQTEEQVGRVCAALHTHGRVEFCHVGEDLVGTCCRLPDILDEINCNASLHASRMLECDRTEIFAADYAFMAEVLAQTMQACREEYEVDTLVSQRLAEAIERAGIYASGVMVLGGARGRVILRTPSTLDTSDALRVSDCIAAVCGYPTEYTSSREREQGEVDTVFSQREVIGVSFARRTVRAEGEEDFCGDTVGVFRNDTCQYAFISDGMGSGREAAVTSGICGMLLQKLLQAGHRCGTAFSMLNSFLRNREGSSLHECSATLDLMELDLFSGRASFYKSGAAPTYVLRDGSLFKLRSKTMPIGILKETDVKRLSFALTPGDVVVMVSDGVTQGREECPWLFDLLRNNVATQGIEKTADLIVRRAKDEGSTDDLSVLILCPLELQAENQEKP